MATTGSEAGGTTVLTGRCAVLGACAMLLLSAAACAPGTAVGPAALGAGRPAYNSMISATDDRQSLAYIVEQRYGYSRTLMAVSSITANVRFSANAEAQFGVGAERNFVGNLVPLTGGLAYEDNPTISYLPLQGDQHLRQSLSPIPLDLVVLLFNESIQYKGSALTMLVERMNGASNLDFPPDPEAPAHLKFQRLVALVNDLAWIDGVQFVQGAGEDRGFYLWLHDYASAHLSQTKELLDILDIEGVEADGRDIYLPVALAPRAASPRGIAIQTRSVQGLARIAATRVDVPQEDIDSGEAITFPPTGPAGQLINILRARERPTNAHVATPYRGWWFYIDASDTISKAYFRIFQALLSVQISGAMQGMNRAPVLTVPVN